jgi:hypothetical protein
MVTAAKLAGVARALVREIAVIALASSIVLMGINGVRYLRSHSAAVARKDASVQYLSVGSNVKLTGVQFAGHPVSFLLVLSPRCRYCVESKVFHRTLWSNAHHQRVPLYIVVPQAEDAREYIESLGASVTESKRWSDLSAQVSGTPTIIAVDSAGKVARMWLGAVGPETETEILNIVRTLSVFPVTGDGGHGSASAVRNYSLAELEQLAGSDKVQVIDPRERGDVQGVRSGTIVIPLLELATRAEFELSNTDLQAVDCSHIDQLGCDHAVTHLLRRGFRVATIGAGSYNASCRATRIEN